jgi:hypothetical protein
VTTTNDTAKGFGFRSDNRSASRGSGSEEMEILSFEDGLELLPTGELAYGDTVVSQGVQVKFQRLGFSIVTTTTRSTHTHVALVAGCLLTEVFVTQLATTDLMFMDHVLDSFTCVMDFNVTHVM